MDYTNTILNEYINKETGSSQVAKGMKQIAESIKIPSYLLEQFKSKTIAASTAQKRLTNATNKITEMSNKYGVSANKITSALETQRLKIDKTGKSLIDVKGRTVSWDHSMGKLRQQMRPFKAHLLSLMFAGMALSKTFGGMVKQVLEMTGVFDVWRATLTMILLPILMPFARWLMQVMFWLMKHKEVAKFVGWFIIFAAALGAVVMFLAMTGLALEGIAAWAAGVELIAWLGKAGILTKLVGTGLGLYFIYKGLKDITEGNILKGIGESLVGVGWFIPGAIGKYAMGIGVALTLADLIINKKEVSTGELITLLLGAGFAGARIGGVYGAMIFIGVTLIAVQWDLIVDAAKELYNIITGIFGMKPKYLTRWEAGRWKPTPEMEEFFKEWPTGMYIGERQYGGYIPRTGAYKLHAGETVTPAGGMGGFAPTINVYANIQSDMDIKRLADRLSVEMGRTFERDYGRRAI